MPIAPDHITRSDDLTRFLEQELGIGGADGPARGDVPQQWRFSGPLWVWRGGGGDSGLPSKGAWYFITINGAVAEAIRGAISGRTGGFGSVKVTAQVGATSWHTSLFPSKDAGGYLLPVKAAVRRAESLIESGTADVVLTMR